MVKKDFDCTMECSRLCESISVEHYLSLTNYAPKGVEKTLNGWTELYLSGNQTSKNGVILIPDYYGWSSGRIRNICDLFGDSSYCAVVPKFSSNELDSSRIEKDSESTWLLNWYKSSTFQGCIKPTIAAIVEFMKRDRGVENIFLLGFKWGGWIALSLIASSIAEEFTCAALAQPNLELGRMYDGSLTELMDRVRRPFLLLPDKEDFELSQRCVQLVRSRLPTTAMIDEHCGSERHYLLHNDADLNAEFRQSCIDSLRDTLNYFDRHANALSEEDVVRGEHLRCPLSSAPSELSLSGLVANTVQDTELIVKPGSYLQQPNNNHHLNRDADRLGKVTENVKDTEFEVGRRSEFGNALSDNKENVGLLNNENYRIKLK